MQRAKTAARSPRGRYVVGNPREPLRPRTHLRAPTRREWLPPRAAHKSGSPCEGEDPRRAFGATLNVALALLMKDQRHPPMTDLPTSKIRLLMPFKRS